MAKIHIDFENEIKINNLDTKYLSGKFVYVPDIKYIEHAFNDNKYNKLSSNPFLNFTSIKINCLQMFILYLI